MAANSPNIAVTDVWLDIVTVNSALANKTIAVQNVGTGVIQIYFGGASAPGPADGSQLAYLDDCKGTAANIWVKSSGKGAVSIFEND